MFSQDGVNCIWKNVSNSTTVADTLAFSTTTPVPHTTTVTHLIQDTTHAPSTPAITPVAHTTTPAITIVDRDIDDPTESTPESAIDMDAFIGGIVGAVALPLALLVYCSCRLRN